MVEERIISKDEIEKLLKEAVLAQERHTDLSKITNTLEIVSNSMSSAVMKIASTLVTRLILSIGAATVWFTIFLFNMRDNTRDLQRQMIDVNKTVAEITIQLQKTSEISRENAASIREIIIRTGMTPSGKSQP